jgi:hypothetical protein
MVYLNTESDCDFERFVSHLLEQVCLGCVQPTQAVHELSRYVGEELARSIVHGEWDSPLT